MRKIAKNRFLDALIKLTLFSAVIHLISLLISAFTKRDLSYFNYFKILDLDILMPNITQGILSQVLSLLTALTLYALAFLFFSEKE
jgi:hypothetical protein